MRVQVNIDASIDFAKTLQKMHKSALPSAIRGTLNKAVYDVKTNTLQKSATDAFEKREPNFFKANSKFENAKGFNVNSMKAIVGMVSTGLQGSNNYAVEDLEQQEGGGTITNKSFIPMKPARSGNKKVRPNARLSSMKNIIDASRTSGKSTKQRFSHAVSKAGVGGLVLGNTFPKRLWRVNSLERTKKGKFKLTPLYSFVQGRKVPVTATHFMRKASLQSGEKMQDIFIQEALRQIKKLSK